MSVPPTHAALPGRPELWLAATPLVLAPAYPPLGWSPLAWIALVPVVWLLRSGPGGPWRWLGLGYAFGLVQAAWQLRWLPRAVLEVGGLPAPLFVPFALATVLFFATGHALVLAATRWAWLRWGLHPGWSLALLLTAHDVLAGVAPFGGNPWGSLAATQAHTIAARLLVPLAGGSALVLALGLVNGLWAAALSRWLRSPAVSASPDAPRARPRRWTGWAHTLRGPGPALVAAALLTALLAAPWPAAQVPAGSGSAAGWRALLVSGGVAPGAPATRPPEGERLRRYLARTLDALRALPSTADSAPAPALIVWPESAAAQPVERGKTLVALADAAGLWGADLLLGSDAVERGRTTNAAYLVQARPFDFVRYDKRVLVPFGEYVPRGFRWLLPGKITAGEDDYAAGAALPVLPWRGQVLGLAICFESILPAHVRAATLAGGQALVVLANDVWLTPAAAAQHVQLTALQGLAVGRDVLFVAEGGWLAHLADGRVLREAPSGGQALLVLPRWRGGRTPWVRWGYAPLAVLCALVAVAAGWHRRSGARPVSGR
ncbi:MAG: apolipoprotein N-acyltransferase [Candidatus Lambdaproteobacteria bacterium]|nr:apolipoprotein N-acyltransferase [Candidatus Lambdaproteobacteria bacterium]